MTSATLGSLRRRSFEGWFWLLWIPIAFVIFSFAVVRSISVRAVRTVAPTQVPLKPCKACMGCACPKILGGPRCACPE